MMRVRWPLLFLVLFLLFILNVSLGSVPIPPDETLTILLGGSPTNFTWKTIILDFRLGKALTCILAGGALSISGLLMQTLFRNPMAGPDVLGLSSGASLFVALVVMAGVSTFFVNAYGVVVAACFGCITVFLIMMIVALRLRDNASLLLVGLMVGAGTSSLVSVLQFISRAEDQQYFLVWTFGSMGSLSWNEVSILAIVTALGSVTAFSFIKALNAWLLGDNYAQSLGINPGRSRSLIIICTCLLTGAVTALCGPIAFVGLAVPHITRIFLKTSDHKILIPGVMIIGASLMLACDSIAQLPGSSMVLPINAITSLIGAPVVIWVIVRAKKLWV
ncbi:iron ABC transporter permease [Oscillatoria amoena NRMC-F 0135]|nr:iron ABC transporter permease [Oscillatoria amoena NRMC-F 0135]